MKRQPTTNEYVCVEANCGTELTGPPGAIVCGRCLGDIVDVTGLSRKEQASRVNLFRLGIANARAAGTTRTFYENWRSA